MKSLIMGAAPKRSYPFELRQNWSMGRLEYDLYRYAYMTRSQYHNTLVIKQTGAE
ncbi:MAG: hypothetical protein F6K00_27090 [Leptolyngbya sp. SIOISBB]|nr:hypothetical protein [Leptolyngbya sp. SIOISBB]